MRALYGVCDFDRVLGNTYSLINIDKFIHIEVYNKIGYSFPKYIMIAEGSIVFKYYAGNKDEGVKLVRDLLDKFQGEIYESNIL